MLRSPNLSKVSALFNLNRILVFLIILDLSLLSPYRIWASSGAPQKPAETMEQLLKDVDSEKFQYDTELAYWSHLDQNYPWLTEFALGEPITPDNKPLWTFQSDNPLLDEDPYFLRSQSWSPSSENCDSICGYYSEDEHPVLDLPELNKKLTLQKEFKILDSTESYVVFASRKNDIFQEKVPESNEPAQGLFFINKADLLLHAENANPVPVFHFPLPGDGWVGKKVQGKDLSALGQYLVTNANGFVLPIELDDLVTIEQTSRRNFLYTQAQTLLANQLEDSGIALPMPKSTAAFGLLPTGLGSSNSESFSSLEKLDKALRNFSLVPQAHATEEKPRTKRDQIRDAVNQRLTEMEQDGESYILSENRQSTKPKGALSNIIPESVQRWATPTFLYGSTVGAAVYGAQQIEMGQLVTEDISTRILIIGGLFSIAAVASVGLRYTIYRDHFEELHPKKEGETALQKVDRHHRAFLTTYAHSLYFGETSFGQFTRQQLEYLKDRFFSKNQIINKAWEETMGFQIKQSSALPVNWKMVYLGSIVHGMSDSILVAIHLLIFTPWAMQHFGFGSELGVVAAAFATSEVIRNFIGYLKGGAHDYASQVKLIHLNRAKKEADRILISQNKDPQAPANDEQRERIIKEYLERIYTSLGLPTSKEFLFDSVSVIKKIAAKNGFSLDENSLKALSDAEKQNLEKTHFHFSQRHWGKLVPALKMALTNARQAYEDAPTEEGQNVIRTLEWALNHRSFLSPGNLSNTAQKFAGLATSSDMRTNIKGFIDAAKQTAQQELDANASQARERLSGMSLEEHISAAVMDKIDKHHTLGFWGKVKATMKGSFRYFRQQEAQNTRDIRMAAFLMSTSGSVKDVVQYLPESWKQVAGTQGAATAAAELLHRSFTTLYMGKDQGLNPDSQLEQDYGARAHQLVQEMAASDTSLSDSYLYKLRYWEVLRSLSDADRTRFENKHFVPEEMGRVEAKQWAKAREQAQPTLDNMDLDSAVGRKWKSAAQQYAEFIQQINPEADLDQSQWIKATQRRMILVSEFAKNLGLYIADMESSEILEEVIQKASRDFYAEVSQKKMANYISRLSPSEAEFFEARIFYNHFISHYAQTTSDSDKLSANSPEFPGRLQSMRIKLAGKWWGKVPLFFIKSAESAFKNSADAYQAGLRSAITRNIPFASDLFGNFMNYLRIMPYGFSFAYISYYYIWQVKMPYNMYVFMLLFAFTFPVLVEWNNRLMRFFDIKPMDGVPEKLTYSFIHSTLTNPIIMFQLAFSGAIAGILTNSNMLMGFGAAASAYVAKLFWDQFKIKEKEKKFANSTQVVDGELTPKPGHFQVQPQCRELF